MSSAGNEPLLVTVVVPELDAGDEPVQLVQWLVDPGAPVHTGDRIAELLVAGVVFHLASPADGVLIRRFKSAHSRVATGEVLACIEREPDDE